MLLHWASLPKAILAAEARIRPPSEAEMRQADVAGDDVMRKKAIQDCVCCLHCYLHTKAPVSRLQKMSTDFSLVSRCCISYRRLTGRYLSI